MIPFALGISAILAASAMGSSTTRPHFVVASTLRVLAMLLLSWWMLMTPSGGGFIMWPVALFGWLALAWASLIGSAWPDYVAVWAEREADAHVRPERRIIPTVMTMGIGFPLCGVAYAATAWLFLSELQSQIDASGVETGFSTKPVLVTNLAISALMVAGGLVVLVLGPRRNVWYPAQQAYLRATMKRESARIESMHKAVALMPQDAPPLKWFQR